MPDEFATTTDDDEQNGVPVAHDDIMKRLLDYQRQLREGESAASESAPSVVATATAPEELVDLTEVEEAEVVELPELEAEEPEGIAGQKDEAQPPDASADSQVSQVEAIGARPAQEPATEIETGPTAEGPAQAPTGGSSADLQARVEKLEASIEKIATMLAAVRSDFQDVAIRADERIAELEEVLAEVRSGP